MRVFLSLVFLMAIAVPQSLLAVEASPSGALSCLSGGFQGDFTGASIFPVTSPHYRALGALGGLMDADITVSLDGIELGAGIELVTGQSYELELAGAPFKGFLQRLSSDANDLSGSFAIPEGESAQVLESSGDGAVGGASNQLALCAGTVAGVTHLDGLSKTNVKTTITIPANQVGITILQVTVMVSTRSWYHSSYRLSLNDPTEAPAITPVTEAPADTSNRFVLSLWVGLIMFSAPVFFLSL
jgi:hypothetical protein